MARVRAAVIGALGQESVLGPDDGARDAGRHVGNHDFSSGSFFGSSVRDGSQKGSHGDGESVEMHFERNIASVNFLIVL